MKSNQSVIIKSDSEIQIMKEGGKILGLILDKLLNLVKARNSGFDIEQEAINLTKKFKVTPAFLNFEGYKYATCISVNNCVVHGFPTKEPFRIGDLISIDFGIIYKGYNLDAARSKCIKPANKESLDLVQWTKEAFYAGIKNIKEGSTLGDIGYQVEKYANSHKLGIVRDLCGHGIGKSLQENPLVLNYGRQKTGITLKAGMALAIEPMLTLGGDDVVIDQNGWSILTSDFSLAAHWENTIIITKNGVDILTQGNVD